MRKLFVFFFQAEDGIRDKLVTGVQTCALPICHSKPERVVRQLYPVSQHILRGIAEQFQNRLKGKRKIPNCGSAERPARDNGADRLQPALNIGKSGSAPWLARSTRPLPRAATESDSRGLGGRNFLPSLK